MDQFTVTSTCTSFMNGVAQSQVGSHIDSFVEDSIEDVYDDQTFNDFVTPDGRKAVAIWFPLDSNDLVELIEDTTLMDQHQWNAHEEMLEDLNFMSHGHRRYKWLISLTLEQLNWVIK